MKGSMEHEYDTEEGEAFDLLVIYEYVPYTPARLTADPYYSEPADGGYCEEIIFKVTGYRQYDEDGKVTLDETKLTPERSKELSDKFQKMVDDNQRLRDFFDEACTADAESSYEPDWD